MTTWKLDQYPSASKHQTTGIWVLEAHRRLQKPKFRSNTQDFRRLFEWNEEKRTCLKFCQIFIFVAIPLLFFNFFVFSVVLACMKVTRVQIGKHEAFEKKKKWKTWWPNISQNSPKEIPISASQAHSKIGLTL